MKPVTAVTSVLMMLLALAHALRLWFAVPVTVGSTAIPVWVSGLGALVAAALAIGLWRERASGPGRTA